MSNSVLKYVFTFVMGFGILCLDQASKIFIHTQMDLGESHTLISGFFNIAYVQNSGGAFGLFGESPDYIRFILFLLFPIICVALIFIMLKETENRFQVLGLAFILGGASGNYLDRVRLGYVVDFIDWHFQGWHWPTFNIADSFIVMGVGILLFFYLGEMTFIKKKSE